MTDTPTTMGDALKNFAPDFVKQQVSTIVKGLGGRASDAVDLSEQEELAAWMRATASPEEIAQLIAGGADDKTILQTARRYRYALGRAAARGDPEKEVAYHESMAKKAAAFLAANEAAPPAGQAR